MPFDMAPQETKVGQFQKYADAMLRGCAATEPSTPGVFGDCRVEESGRVIRACAYYAMEVGFGNCRQLGTEEHQHMRRAYRAHYGTDMVDDYEKHGFTREQIAARIAAL